MLSTNTLRTQPQLCAVVNDECISALRNLFNCLDYPGQLDLTKYSKEIQDYVNAPGCSKKKRKRSLLFYDDMLKELEQCGRFAKFEIHCLHCNEQEKRNANINSLLGLEIQRMNCQIKICEKPCCKSVLYKRTMNRIKINRRLKNLKTLIHAVLGFEKVSQEFLIPEVKRLSALVWKIIKGVKKLGYPIDCLIVMDISKGKNIGGAWDGKYFIHFHLGIVPVKKTEYKGMLKAFQDVRASMIKRKQGGFHFQSFGNKGIRYVISYLSIRAVGLYKHFEEQNFEKRITAKALIHEIESGRFMHLADIISKEEYHKYFYGKRGLRVFGDQFKLKNCLSGEEGVPYGSNLVNEVGIKKKYCCALHGVLERYQLKIIEIPFGEPPPPDLHMQTGSGVVVVIAGGVKNDS